MSQRDKLLTPTHIVALQKITQAITGLGTALMVAHFLSPEEQGYFYTMGSLLSSYIIFDLGLSSYLLQRSAELSRDLTIDRFGNISPEGKQRDEFLAFSYWVFKWYRNAGIIAFIVMAPIGVWVLSHNTNATIGSNWIWPWMVIVTAIAINMPTIGFFAVLEGTGAICQTYLLRIAHYATGATLAWGLIAIGHGLYAQALPVMSTVFVCYVWFFYRYRTIYSRLLTAQTKHINCIVLPHIKYTASIWLFNYIFLNIPVILSFVLGDVVSSGKLGLSIIIANVGGAVAMASVTAKIPKIIQNIDAGLQDLAEGMFITALKKFGWLYLTGSCVLVLVAKVSVTPGFPSRLLNPVDLSLLLLAFAGFHVLNACNTYLRALGNNALSKKMLPTIIFTIPIVMYLNNVGSSATVIWMLCVISINLVFLSNTAKDPSERFNV